MAERINAVKTSFFGKGAIRLLGPELQKMGIRRALLVTDRFLYDSGAAARVGQVLSDAGVEYAVYYNVQPNPTVQVVNDCIAAARTLQVQLLVALGGGSVMDASKGIAFAYYNDAPIFEYIYRRKQGGQALPILLIATTAGTGSEGNWTAVFTDTDHVKKGFALPALYPKESIVDPELMTTLSSRGIAGPGFDALAHAIEHPDQLAAMKADCRKLYERYYTNEAYVSTLVRLIRELTESR